MEIATAQADGTSGRVLSTEQAQELFDTKARQWLGISGKEFLRRWTAGEYDDADCDSKPKIMRLVMLLPFAR